MALVEFSEAAPRIGLLTLNDPDNLNAMSEAMAREFKDRIAELQSKKDHFRALILTGAGRAFSAGGDLTMLEKKTTIAPEENKRLMMEFYHSFLGMLRLNIPLIAAINGHAIGAGLCVACACDIRIAAEGAKLGITFTKLGLHPGMGGTFFIPRIIGTAAARELILTGRVIDAAEGQRVGLVSRVVAAGKALTAAQDTAQEILSCGPLATAQVLQTLRPDHAELEAALQHEADCQKVNYASAEFKEGVRATKEKRKPNF